jgi:hypothetical protein
MKIVETYIVIEHKTSVFDESQEEISFNKAYKTSGGYFFLENAKTKKLTPITGHKLDAMMLESYRHLDKK